MADYIFRKNSVETFHWRPELGEGENFDAYFDYLWFDFVFDDGHYMKIAPHMPFPIHSNGIEEGGIPALAVDFIAPNGSYRDQFTRFKPGEIELLPFGCVFGGNVFRGEINDKGEVDEFEVHYDQDDLALDVKCKTIATGIQFVAADHGYSYYNPVKNLAMGWWPLIARAQFEGTLRVDGKTIPAKGILSVDRQAANKADTFGDAGQAWWTWGHFHCGPYTGTFTDSAGSAKYKYAHFSPLVIWKNSELFFASYDFVNYIEQFEVNEQWKKFIPKVMSMRAHDGATTITTQISNGQLCERENTSLGYIKYARQFADITMQVARYGGVFEEVSGKIIVEFGAGPKFFPFQNINWGK